MVGRRHRARPGQDNPLLSDIAADDAFLTALSRGERPQGADDDEVADVLLALRADAHRPMPEVPAIPDAEMPDELSRQRGRGRGSRSRHGHVALGIRYGLLGAAAASVLIAGAGITVYNAHEDSPLYALSAKVFGDRQALVELAGTLDEAGTHAEKGDIDGARTLINRARGIVTTIDRSDATPEPPTAAPEEAPPVGAPRTPLTTAASESYREDDRVTTVTVTETPEPITVTQEAPAQGADPEEATATGNRPVPYLLNQDALHPEATPKNERPIDNQKRAAAKASELGNSVASRLEH